MVNLFEKEVFEKVARKRRGEDVFVGVNRAMLSVSGVDSRGKCKTELGNIMSFVEQFEEWYNDNWEVSGEGEIERVHKGLLTSEYMYNRLDEIKGNRKLVRESDGFLIDNPFRSLGKNQATLASWISLCASLKIKEIGLLGDGNNVGGYFVDRGKDCIFDPVKRDWAELGENSGYVRYSKSSIVSEILTQRALGKYRDGEVDAAIYDCNKALMISPKYLGSLFCRGLARKDKGMAGKGGQIYLEGAIRDFECLVGESPTHWKSYFEMMGVYHKLGKTMEADDCMGRGKFFAGLKLHGKFDREVERLKGKGSLVDRIFPGKC